MFPNQRINLMYDIACILKKHLMVTFILCPVHPTLFTYYHAMYPVTQNSNQLGLLSDLTFAVPVFHAYGHNSSCQVHCMYCTYTYLLFFKSC